MTAPEYPNTTVPVLPYANASQISPPKNGPPTWEQIVVKESGPEVSVADGGKGQVSLAPTLYGSGWTTGSDDEGGEDKQPIYCLPLRNLVGRAGLPNLIPTPPRSLHWPRLDFYYTTTEKGTNYAKYTSSPNEFTISGLYTVSIKFPETCPSASHTTHIPVVVQAGATTIATTVEVPSSFEGSTEITSLYFNKTSFISITVDTQGTTNCVAIGKVDIELQPDTDPVPGCMDFKAANYRPEAETDDNSCLYAKGRGLTTQSWSFMNPTYEDEAWYQSSLTETTYMDPVNTCSAPNGYGADIYDIASCDSSSCDLHSQCGPSSFCCLSSHHPGCNSHWDTPGTSATSPWRTMLYQDLEADCYFQESSGNDHIAKNKYSDSEDAKSCYSYLDEFESMRQTR